MCTANQWTIPVVLFGRIFPKEQYVAIFTSYRGHVFRMFARVVLNDNMDLTSRISEMFLALIEDSGYLPSFSYVVDVDNNHMRIGMFD